MDCGCHPRPEPVRAEGKGIQRDDEAAKQRCMDHHTASLRDSISHANAASADMLVERFQALASEVLVHPVHELVGR